jgi:DNA (cytosine-5)-methyltransferase 1
LNYYNEFDKYAAAWIRALISAGEIPDGHVDERSICDVRPGDLEGYTQCHFFAGIAGWPFALKLAEWPADEPIWTGSCPCQPFSSAGQQRGTADERHLWPVLRSLIEKRSPPVVAGEQVASPLGRLWLSGVRSDLEALGYAVGGSDLCAAGVGADHIRQRIFWVADSDCSGRARTRSAQPAEREGDSFNTGPSLSLRVGDTYITGSQGWIISGERAGEWAPWSSGVAVLGRDGRYRRFEPGIPPVAPRLPTAVALIRGSGNSIVPQLAAEFIKAWTEVTL